MKSQSIWIWTVVVRQSYVPVMQRDPEYRQERVDTVSRKDHIQRYGKEWAPGHHYTAIGPTGRGKSRMTYQSIREIIRNNPDIFVISMHGKVKKRDPEVMGSAAKMCNLRMVKTLPGNSRQSYDRKVKKYNGYLLVPIDKPGETTAEEEALLRDEFGRAIRQNYKNTKDKTITHVNEAHQTQYELGLRKACEGPLMRGAPDNTMHSEIQRGKYVSYHTFGAPEDMIIFYDDDADNRRRYSDFGAADPDYIMYLTSGLKTGRSADGRTISQALYIHRGGGMYIVDM